VYDLALVIAWVGTHTSKPPVQQFQRFSSTSLPVKTIRYAKVINVHQLSYSYFSP
jgi:hypothetical protein